MVREPDATMQPTPQDNQLMSKHRVLSFKPQLRLEWRGQDGQNETEQPDHSASLGDSITSSTQIRFSVHTAPTQIDIWILCAIAVGNGFLLGWALYRCMGKPRRKKYPDREHRDRQKGSKE